MTSVPTNEWVSQFHKPTMPAALSSAPGADQRVLYGDASTAANTTTKGSTLTTAAIAASASAGATSPFSINLVWDASTASAPAAFKTAMIAAVQYLESVITTAATINIDVGYGEIAGNAMGAGALGESSSYLISVSYGALISALQAHNTSATTASVLASLPANCPVSGTVCVTTAEAKALGLLPAGSAADAYLGFSSSYGFTYNDSNGVAAGTYDFNAVALHELTETMGRVMLTGAQVFPGSASYSLLDLLHYSAAGTRDFSASQPGYFSANGGTTNGGTFNTVPGGDAADWASGMGNNSFDAFLNAGVTGSFTAADLTEMNALGWKLASTTSTPPASPPTGMTITPVTNDAALQTGSKLAGGQALMSFSQTGGKAGDGFAYSLSGSGASTFTLSTAGKLSTASAGVSGAAAGKLYELAVTVTDSTANVSSTAQQLDVVVGSTGQTTLTLAQLAGFSPNVPYFIYPGSGNNVSVDASGLSARAVFFAGAGSNSFTGGSGVNDYVFGSTTDSTADIIRNFHTSKDLLDFTGITTRLGFAGAINGASLAADMIGYEVSGGNTYVYVNTSGVAESLGKTDMRVELLGNLTIGAANIVHL